MTNKHQTAQIRIRSFIRRQGRLTTGQQQALDRLWDQYCLDAGRDCDFAKVFVRQAPLILEIGFGNGESLAQMALSAPQNNYLGVEVHRPGVGHLMLQLEAKNISNVRIYCHDAIEIIEHRIPDTSLDGLHLFFPDPWPKKRHHKRRIVNPEFVTQIVKKLKPDGYFHAATDWENYAQVMLELLSADSNLVNASGDKGYCPRPDYRPMTKFESRGIRLGHGVWDLIFRKAY